jgi:hypothetical protein
VKFKKIFYKFEGTALPASGFDRLGFDRLSQRPALKFKEK